MNTAFQSLFIWAAGIVGFSVKSLYAPLNNGALLLIIANPVQEKRLDLILSKETEVIPPPKNSLLHHFLVHQQVQAHDAHTNEI